MCTRPLLWMNLIVPAISPWPSTAFTSPRPRASRSISVACALDIDTPTRPLPAVLVRLPAVDRGIQLLDVLDRVALLADRLLRASRRNFQVDRRVFLAGDRCFLLPEVRSEALQRGDAVLSGALVAAELAENLVERHSSDVSSGVKLPPTCQVVLDVSSVSLRAGLATKEFEEAAHRWAVDPDPFRRRSGFLGHPGLVSGRVAPEQSQLGQCILLIADVETFGIGVTVHHALDHPKALSV